MYSMSLELRVTQLKEPPVHNESGAAALISRCHGDKLSRTNMMRYGLPIGQGLCSVGGQGLQLET